MDLSNEYVRRNEHVHQQLSALKALEALGLSFRDAEAYLAYRQMEIEGLLHKSVHAQQRLQDLRTQYGADLLEQVK